MINNVAFLIELRARLLRAAAVWGVVAAICTFFSNQIYTMLALPLLKQLSHHTLIAIDITAPLFIPLQCAMMLSVYICMPFFLFQLWQFIAPALYRRERNAALLFLCLGTLLFFSGSLFSYAIALPMLFHFLNHTVPAGVTYMPDMSSYFSMVMRSLLVFGLAFELPIIIVCLTRFGILSIDTLTDKRPYVIVGIFTVGMLLTPPDVLSQITLALPLWALYELGLLMAKWIVRKNRCKVPI